MLSPADKRWVGDLTALQPGEGYLFRRLAPGTVEIAFHSPAANNAIRRQRTNDQRLTTGSVPFFSNPNAETNMTLIAQISKSENEEMRKSKNEKIFVFINDDLVGVASPCIIPSLSSRTASPLSESSPLYFLTVQSDKVGTLRFQTEDGTLLTAVNYQHAIPYVPDTHIGSVKEPVRLVPASLETTDKDDQPYKIIENDHVIIIRNNQKYSIDGKKLQ